MQPASMLIGGAWVDAVAGEREDVTSPFDGHTVGNVPVARAADATRAIDAAVSGFERWRRTPAHERAAILMRAAAIAMPIEQLKERGGAPAAIVSRIQIPHHDPGGASGEVARQNRGRKNRF